MESMRFWGSCRHVGITITNQRSVQGPIDFVSSHSTRRPAAAVPFFVIGGVSKGPKASIGPYKRGCMGLCRGCMGCIERWGLVQKDRKHLYALTPVAGRIKWKTECNMTWKLGLHSTV